MGFFSILFGIICGFGSAYTIFYLLNQNRNIPKRDFEDLSFRYHEANTLLQVSEANLISQKQEHSKLESTFQLLQKEFNSLQNQKTALDTILKSNESQISELGNSFEKSQATVESKQSEINNLKGQLSEVNANYGTLTENLRTEKGTTSNLNIRIDQLLERLEVLNSENSTLKANNKGLQDKIDIEKAAIIELQKTSHLQFEKIANQILEEKSGKFTEVNKINIDSLLKPLGENLIAFKKQVEETYSKESRERFSLEKDLKTLVEQTNKVSAEANNLATALKGQAKKQGNWGEVILESILQHSGLVKDREYFLQPTMKDENGKSLRPDVLVKLPDNRIIIIDSKVSLVAYDRYCATDVAEEQALSLQQHLSSIYSHIDSLHGKQYDNLKGSLDFTMMFVPIEPAYLISVQKDQELWSKAYSKRIILISPTNLIACLKLMSNLWKKEKQSKSAAEIVERGNLLYEKFVGFAESFKDMGRSLKSTQDHYDVAMNRLKSGSGNIVSQAMQLKNYGIKSTKSVPDELIPIDFDPNDDIQAVRAIEMDLKEESV